MNPRFRSAAEGPMVRRLSAGGRWIRTLGPGMACRRATPYRRLSGLPTARAAALELEGTPNPRRCRLTISHHGLGRMLTNVTERSRDLGARALSIASDAQITSNQRMALTSPG